VDRTTEPSAPELKPVRIQAGQAELCGDLLLPRRAGGIVLFAHGSGSSRHSPRNRLVARALQEAGLGTLLMDLLSEREEAAEAAGAMRRFDVELLADRLARAAEWVEALPEARGQRIGYFGASTEAAAALVAAAARPQHVRAVVSRGGRPDLASPDVLARVQAPTLLIVGSKDRDVLRLNRLAYDQLRCERQLRVVEGATHLFEEPGTLEKVAAHARDWLLQWLAPARPPAHPGRL